VCIVADSNDLVILLPGITGSVLADRRGKEVWAPSMGAVWRAIVSGGDSITGLELAGDDVDDGVTATGLVPDVTIVPGLVKIDGYTRIARALCQRLGLAEGQNFHPFPYDWRRDNERNATRLQAQAMAWLKAWRNQPGRSQAKLVLIGHSMGGLIARWFVECLGGWKDTRALITLGTPHRGSLNAVGFIENGMKKGVGPFGLDLSPLLRSYTSVYQLLPIYPCIDAGGALQRVEEAAQAHAFKHMDASRASAARAFHTAIAEAQARNTKEDAYQGSGYTMLPIVGSEQPTAQSARLAGGRCTLVNELGGEDLAGDGTVPRVSATPIDMQGKNREIYAAETHGALQNNEGTLANLVGMLTADQIDWRKFQQAADRASLSLDLDDVLLPGEPLVLRVHASEGEPRLTARLLNLADGTVAEEALSRDGERGTGWSHGEFALPAGTWRVSVHGEGVAPVSDLVLVAAPG
jgi:pimeloyl-ACP methyl ester carboxylesterase